jgi:hypothetical protein
VDGEATGDAQYEIRDGRLVTELDGTALEIAVYKRGEKYVAGAVASSGMRTTRSKRRRRIDIVVAGSGHGSPHSAEGGGLADRPPDPEVARAGPRWQGDQSDDWRFGSSACENPMRAPVEDRPGAQNGGDLS